ncbi:MAG: Asp-tRNA(Asn)/Glu-tRNA(Gln) amidotransferase subunit GatA [Terriglobales bacterium]
MTELPLLSVETVRQQLRERQITAVALTAKCYQAIAAANGQLNAYLTLCPDRARAQAERMDRLADQGQPLPPLAGVPVAVKDVLSTRGVRTTCGSRILENYVPEYDATAVERLEAAGAVILGKVNCDEFAMGSSNETSAFGPVHNPWDLARVPGGSSGGSAAVVAAGLGVAALGSDTGGSIRQPAAFCGVVGLLPTYGRVSRFGLVAFGSSLDHVGPLARSAKDVAYVLSAIAGADGKDATSAATAVPDYLAELEQPIQELRIGIPREAFAASGETAGLDPRVSAGVQGALAALERAGCRLVEISLPHGPYATATYYLIATAEASANLARYDGVRYGLRAAEPAALGAMYRQTRDLGFGPEVKRRILLGTYALSAGYYDAYYRRAQRVRARIAEDYRQAFAAVDVIAMPTTPTPAFRLGERIEDPLRMYLNDIYTVSADLAGVPAISVPCALADGLPVGVQFIGNYFAEGLLLRLAHHYERLRGPVGPPPAFAAVGAAGPQ